MDERDLIPALRRGDPDGFRGVVDAFWPQVMALALNVLGNRQDAEDACQETFLQVHRKLDSYDPERSFKTWVLTIVYRRCLDMIKRRRRFHRFADRVKADAAEALRVRSSPEPPGVPLPSALLDGLSPREKTALALWANEDCTAAEIAGILGCAAGTARVYLFNARRKIKARMEAAS